MIRLPIFSPIDFLVSRKFPRQKEVQKIAAFGNDASSREHAQEQLEKIEAYEAELTALSSEEFTAFLKEEQAKEQTELRMMAEIEERQRFFNRPDAVADFAHWSKMTYWKLDEAIALAFGKAPEVVTWEGVEKHTRVSPFAMKYFRVRDLALRAKAWEQLYDPVLPSIFLAWARRTEIEVPAELVQSVEARGIIIADWKDLHDKLKEQFDEALLLVQRQSERITNLEKDRDALNVQIENAASKPESKAEKALTTRERNNVARIVAALTQAAGIDLSDPYKAAKAIEVLTEQNGTRVSDDTIVKWLNQAAELLEPRSK